MIIKFFKKYFYSQNKKIELKIKYFLIKNINHETFPLDNYSPRNKLRKGKKSVNNLKFLYLIN